MAWDGPARPTKQLKSKVYPSVQLRTVQQLEQLSAAGSALEECADSAEGLGSLVPQKIADSRTRIEAKLAKDEEILLEPNQHRRDSDGTQEDLGARGRLAVEAANSTCERLMHLERVVTSYKSREATSLEHAPAFLLRTVTEAKDCELVLPWATLYLEIIQRQALTMLEENDTKGCIAVLDTESGKQHGIGVGMLDEASVAMRAMITEKVSCCVLGRLLDDPDSSVIVDAVPLLVATLRGEEKKMMAGGDDGDDRKAALETMRALPYSLERVQHLVADSAPDVMDGAIKSLQPNGEALESIRTVFASPSGRRVIAEARATMLRRVMEAALRNDLNVIDVAMQKLRSDLEMPSDTPVESMLVTSAFAGKSAAKCVAKFSAVTKKASELFRTEQKRKIDSIMDAKAAVARSLIGHRCTGFWNLISGGPLSFLAETASNLAIPPARLAQIGESVRSRPFVLVTTGLESVGLKALVEQKAFEAEEKKIKIMESFVSALAKMALPSEDDEVMEVKWCFQNKAFLGAWTILVDELDAFKSDSVFFATTSPEDVAKAMSPIAQGIEDQIRAFVEGFVQEHAWFKRGITKPPPAGQKTQWPTTLPEFDSEAKDMLEAAFGFILKFKCSGAFETVVARSALELDCEVTVFFPLLAYLHARRDMHETAKGKSCELKVLKKKHAAFRSMAEALEAAMKAALSTPTMKFKPWLECERKIAAEKMAELYDLVLQTLGAATKNAQAIASLETLEMNKFYDTDELQVEKLTEIVNSKDAAALKAAWAPLINVKAFEDEFVEDFTRDEFTYLIEAIDGSSEEHQLEVMETFYAVRDKVCEMAAVRALTRPLRSDRQKGIQETRAEAVEKSQAVIEELEGSLSPRLGLLLAAVTASASASAQAR